MVQLSEQFMQEEGIKAGNEIVREILSMKREDGKPVVSKYRMAKDLGVERATVYNWLRGTSSPLMRHYLNLKTYRLHIERLARIPRFTVA